jgi:hypothetical protein
MCFASVDTYLVSLDDHDTMHLHHFGDVIKYKIDFSIAVIFLVVDDRTLPYCTVYHTIYYVRNCADLP